MEKKYNYVYKTSNLLNGKQYIGDHSTDDLNDGYIGSGRPIFDNAKRKYGKENFKKEILEFFDTKDEAFKAQEKWIKEFNTLIPNGYNISPTGGIGCVGCFSDETKKILSEKSKGKNNPMYKKSIYDIWVEKYGKEEADIRNENRKKKISDKLKGKNNPFYGKTHTDKIKMKISETHKGKNISETHKNQIREYHKNKK